ncbi:hypothetical protein BHE74_00016298 [Ensete ventricosum]|nr:hypothetical protein GW17_00009240 [Ensete ventricosum]RWW75663.1 hypothetical protein BHE74_00016298 [Ensete ventricosum]RZR96935.1 hypothetical protein BHM03_00026037 [Ensete ventricosum]
MGIVRYYLLWMHILPSLKLPWRWKEMDANLRGPQKAKGKGARFMSRALTGRRSSSSCSRKLRIVGVRSSI